MLSLEKSTAVQKLYKATRYAAVDLPPFCLTSLRRLLFSRIVLLQIQDLMEQVGEARGARGVGRGGHRACEECRKRKRKV
jgi:hypothetical protein